MSLASDISAIVRVIVRAIDGRRQRREWAAYERERTPLPLNHYTAAIYFADSLVNMYQIQQWYAPMVELAKTQPVAVIARDVKTANTLRRECPLPVVLLPYIADVETWVDQQRLGAVFYLNQNSRNFQMMRFRQPAHVFLSHGESDKDYMASNQLKAYDYTFIAGDAARERIAARLIDYDVMQRTVEIGRPQVDVDYPGPTLPSDDRVVVLYAPTWEGDRPSMTYSSVVSHGESMLRSLVATGRHRVIYRPHPRTGISDSTFLDAHKRLVGILRESNSADDSANHIVDTDTAFGWHLKAADECIADISAVAFDWLMTTKPLVLTQPSSENAQVDPDGIGGQIGTLAPDAARDIVSRLEEGSTADAAAIRVAAATHYFGNCAQGASMRRWLTAATDVINDRTDKV